MGCSPPVLDDVPVRSIPLVLKFSISKAKMLNQYFCVQNIEIQHWRSLLRVIQASAFLLVLLNLTITCRKCINLHHCWKPVVDTLPSFPVLGAASELSRNIMDVYMSCTCSIIPFLIHLFSM